MITESFVRWIVRFGGSILAPFAGLPNIEFDPGAKEAISYVIEMIQSVCYFLPMDTVRSIFSIVLAFISIRITLAVISKIWDLLPIL